jgi:hypothetical protein
VPGGETRREIKFDVEGSAEFRKKDKEQLFWGRGYVQKMILSTTCIFDKIYFNQIENHYFFNLTTKIKQL